MADLDAIVKAAEQRVATSLAGGARKPEDGLLWADVYHPQATQALVAIGFRELVEALMPFAERGRSVSVDEIRRAAAVIAKLEADHG